MCKPMIFTIKKFQKIFKLCPAQVGHKNRYIRERTILYTQKTGFELI